MSSGSLCRQNPLELSRLPARYRFRLISPSPARLMLALLLPALINYSKPVFHCHKVHSIILSYPAIYHTYTTMSSALQPRKMSKYQISVRPLFLRFTFIPLCRLVRPSRWAHWSRGSRGCGRASRSGWSGALPRCCFSQAGRTASLLQGPLALSRSEHLGP